MRDEDSIILFHHDPVIQAARIARDPKEGFVVRQTVALYAHEQRRSE